MAKKRTTQSKPSRSKRLGGEWELVRLANEFARAAEVADDGVGSSAEGPARAAELAAELRAIDELVNQNEGPLPDEAIRGMLREFYSGLRAVRRSTRVAYLGPEHTYSHLAAVAYFGQSVEWVPVASIAAVFEEVEAGNSDYGVVPVENSTDGRVADALHCLAHRRVQICGEAPLRIRHCLLGSGGRSDVRRVCSKPQALSQCRNWLSKHLPSAELVETASTSAAAAAARSDPRTAAIASEEAATPHQLKVLAKHIEDNPDNVTRFAVIGQDAAARTGRDKTAVVFETAHEPGALADAMGIFKRQQLNLTWIESFPSPEQRGRYLFFVEFEGHASDLKVRRALASLQKRATRLTILGSYAQAEPIG
jgi:chorismate mutase/prephenate dehydratase